MQGNFSSTSKINSVFNSNKAGLNHKIILLVGLLVFILFIIIFYFLFINDLRKQSTVRIEENVVSKKQTTDSNVNFDNYDFELNDQFLLRENTSIASSMSKVIDLYIPSDTSRIQLIVAAPSSVGHNLIDPNKVVLETIDAGSKVAMEKFRSFDVVKPIEGLWSVELTNKHPVNEAMAMVAVKVYDYPLKLKTDVGVEGDIVNIFAYLSRKDSLITGAKIQAEIENVSQISKIYDLYDDGMHSDGIANDGIYGNKTDNLVEGGYFVIIRARDGERSVISLDDVYVGE